MSAADAYAAVAAAEGAAVEKPSRKFPPPCWTQEETLALIDAYRERWYALRRGYLRTADWDAVAAAVSSRCPDASPAKTSAQCRHKMEKLRQRYRAEKQRSLSYPTGRFFSSWFFFANMDAMENETSPSAVKSNLESGNRQNSSNGFHSKTFLDQNVLKLKLNPKINSKLNGDSSPHFVLNHGVRVNNSSKIVDGKVSSNFGAKVLNGYASYLDAGSEKEEDEMDFEGGFHLKNPLGRISVPIGLKGKNFGNAFGDMKIGYEFGSLGGKGFDATDGFHMNSLGDESLLPPRFRAKRTGKIDVRLNRGVNFGEEESNEADANDGFWGREASDWNSVPSGARGNYGVNLDSDIDSRGLNAFSNPFRLGAQKKSGSSGGGGIKRERNAIDEMVLSIKMLGEGFVKMEKMKMDMAMEIEKNRMEMEMKRNELILESQRQIVDAFIKGLIEVKNKKVKTTATSES